TKVIVYRTHSSGDWSGCARDPCSREYACSPAQGMRKTTKSKGHLQFAVVCAECAGTGWAAVACQECAGEGRLPGTEILEVELPPAMAKGAHVRIPGKGDAGGFGGQAGTHQVLSSARANSSHNH